MRHAHPAVKHVRRLFCSGRLRPTREPRPCTQGHHAGPFVRRTDLDAWMADLFGALGVVGKTFVHYDCARCGSSIDMGYNEVAA